MKGNRSGHEGDLDELAKAIKKSLDGKEKKKVDGVLKKEDLKDLDACADYALTVAASEKTKANMHNLLIEKVVCLLLPLPQIEQHQLYRHRQSIINLWTILTALKENAKKN